MNARIQIDTGRKIMEVTLHDGDAIRIEKGKVFVSTPIEADCPGDIRLDPWAQDIGNGGSLNGSFSETAPETSRRSGPQIKTSLLSTVLGYLRWRRLSRAWGEVLARSKVDRQPR